MIAQELARCRSRNSCARADALGCTYWCGGPGSVHTDEAVLKSMGEAIASGVPERMIRASWEANVSPAFAADAAAWARFLEISLRRRVALEVIVAQTQACIEHDTSARLHEIALPTQIIHGTVDQVLPLQNGRIVSELIPDARLELLEDVGHLFFWERPERAAELLGAHVAAYA